MKKILAIAFIWFSIHAASACAWDGEYYFSHLFGKELLSDTLYQMYYDLEPYCDECMARGSKANLMEWKQKLGTSASLEDIAASVYEGTYAELLSAYNRSNPRNEFEKALFKNKDLLNYLLFAKMVEPLCTLDYEEFGDAPQRSPEVVAKLNQQVDTLKTLIPSIQDTWVKQRYVMQLVRLSFFANRYAETISFYDQWVDSKFEKNSIYFRTLAYKGGALRKSNQLAQSKLAFAQVFDQSPDYRHLAYKNFKYIDVDNKLWDELVSLTKSPSELTCIWFMQEIYMGNLNLDYLKQIFKNDPSSARLEVAAMRQINRMEESLFMPARMNVVSMDSTLLTYGDESTWEFGAGAQEEEGWWSRFWKSIVNFFRRLFGMKEITHQQSSNPSVLAANFNYYSSNPERLALKDSETLKAMKELLVEILKGENLKNKPLFQLLYAYTLMVSEDYAEAETLIQEASKSSNLAIQKQAEFLTLLNLIWKSENVTEELETSMVAWCKKFDEEKKKLEYDNDRDFRKELLLAELGRLYWKNNRFDEGVITFYYGTQYSSAANAMLDWYYSDDDMVRIASWKETYTSAWIEYCSKEFYSTNQLAEIRAVKMLRKGKFTEAADLFAANKADTSKKFTVMTSLDKYPSQWNEAMETFTQQELATKYSALLKSGKPEDLAAIGNSVALTNYWCYNNNLWKGWGCLDALTQYEGSEYPFNLPNISVDFHNRHKAFAMQYATDYMSMKYYKQAANLSQNPEQKAQILFNAITDVPVKYVSYSHPKVNLNYDSLYSELKGNLRSTKVVQDALISCPSFADYKVQ